jgi:hypothetical protein
MRSQEGGGEGSQVAALPKKAYFVEKLNLVI